MELTLGNAAAKGHDWIKIWVQPTHKSSFSHCSCSHTESDRDNCYSNGLVETLVTKENGLFCGDLQEVPRRPYWSSVPIEPFC